MKSIPFSAPMVRALPIKTQTRRLSGMDDVNKYPGTFDGESPLGALGYRGLMPSSYYLKDKKGFQKSPGLFHWFLGRRKGEINPIPLRAQYEVGDEVYVREPWRTVEYFVDPGVSTEEFDLLSPNELPDGAPLWYLADPEPVPPVGLKWGRYRHSRFMPQRFSRHTITITEVRVQRLQDISEGDAIAEGIQRYDNNTFGLDDPAACMGPTAVMAYMRLWNHINGQAAWDANPYVWVYTFERKAAA